MRINPSSSGRKKQEGWDKKDRRRQKNRGSKNSDNEVGKILWKMKKSSFLASCIMNFMTNLNSPRQVTLPYLGTRSKEVRVKRGTRHFIPYLKLPYTWLSLLLVMKTRTNEKRRDGKFDLNSWECCFIRVVVDWRSRNVSGRMES